MEITPTFPPLRLPGQLSTYVDRTSAVFAGQLARYHPAVCRGPQYGDRVGLLRPWRSGLNIAGRDGLNQLMSDVEEKRVNLISLLVYS